MRDEDAVQKMADKASAEIARINESPPMNPEKYARREWLRAVLSALDWVMEDQEDDPI